MVKSKNRQKAREIQGESSGNSTERNPRITANTPYASCHERLTAFGGLLALIKMLDLINFKESFEKHYVHPKRTPKLGCRRMISGILMLLFIGFQRLWHFEYVRRDVMVCGILRVKTLPAACTFWRYLRSLGIVQSASLLRLGSALRKRVWELLEYAPKKVSINIDTTTTTVYGAIEGSRIGYNPKHRGKKGLRPVMFFLDETREYLCGTQRSGKTIGTEELAKHIRNIRKHLPECVKDILVRGDGEMMGWKSVQACNKAGFGYIFGNKQCEPPFEPNQWYRHGEYDYNECVYQPTNWEEPCRFVVMRMREEIANQKQLNLPECEGYVYRIFVTNLADRPHTIIANYARRAGVESLIGEAQREGLLAIPSRNFQSNHAFFQIVMLAYNLWRWMKLMAGHCEKKQRQGLQIPEERRITMPDHTIRIARLKLLYVAAKIQYHGGQDVVRYSMHDARASGLMDFLRYLDQRRKVLPLAA
jgi:hypothetical protein